MFYEELVALALPDHTLEVAEVPLVDPYADVGLLDDQT